MIQRSLPERQHVLVKAPQRDGAGIRFILQNDVHVPEQLAGLAEVFRFMYGVMMRDRGNGFQLPTALWIAALRGHRLCEDGVAQNVPL